MRAQPASSSQPEREASNPSPSRSSESSSGELRKRWAKSPQRNSSPHSARSPTLNDIGSRRTPKPGAVSASPERLTVQGRAARSLLDCAADLPEVLAERVRRIVGTVEQVLVERGLRTQCLAGRNPQRLLAFDLPDRAGGVEHFINSFRRNEDDTVIVGEHDVVTCDRVFAEARARERLGLLRIESQRSGR